jgi:hypothetical protein
MLTFTIFPAINRPTKHDAGKGPVFSWPVHFDSTHSPKCEIFTQISWNFGNLEQLQLQYYYAEGTQNWNGHTSMILDSLTLRIKVVCPFTTSEQNFTTWSEHIENHHYIKAW